MNESITLNGEGCELTFIRYNDRVVEFASMNYPHIGDLTVKEMRRLARWLNRQAREMEKKR